MPSITTNRLFWSTGTTFARFLGYNLRTSYCKDLICPNWFAIWRFFMSRAFDIFCKTKCCCRRERPDPFRSVAACNRTWAPISGVRKSSGPSTFKGVWIFGQATALFSDPKRRGLASGTNTFRGHSPLLPAASHDFGRHCFQSCSVVTKKEILFWNCVRIRNQGWQVDILTIAGFQGRKNKYLQRLSNTSWICR